ncbi:MAG: prepilin-type N-terminal cleavage/methylation domain-containing protein [Burkholderiales bacterium]|nr:prepilin-type N-terminal cleavage/methylation domain-containing protein [Burkholderiales bacterium]
MPTTRPRGFTLLELMITVAVVAMLTAIALPAYTAYITRSRVPAALDALSAYASRMEQTYQDVGNYGVANCTPTLPTATNFTVSCSITNGGQGYTATATGSGTMTGYTYSIDNTGTRRTVAHPKGTPPANCWSLKGAKCDS